MHLSSSVFLSVCILTRNEEQFIGDCIRSVKSIADEILVLDSYSTDRTTEIASALGATVMQEPWIHFSFNRNVLIKKAQGKWILVLDADEELHNARFLKARLRYLTGKKTGGFVMERTEVFRHKDSGKVESVPIGLVRLFRNDHRVYFEHELHETVDASLLREGFEIRTLQRARLRHKIFLYDRATIDAKQRKYLDMIGVSLTGDPDDSWMLFHKAKTLWYFERTDEALATYKHVIGLASTSRNVKATACCHAASLSVHRGDADGAIAYLEQSLALVKHQALAWVIRGDLYFSQQSYTDALACYDALPTAPPAAYADCVFSYLYTPAPMKLFKMGCCHLALGNIRKAYFLFRSGVRIQSASSENWLGLAHCYHARKQYPQALNTIARCLSLNPEWDQAFALKEKIVTGKAEGAKA